MRSLGIFTIFAALTAFSALAAKVDTDTGEGCFGVGCFDGEVTVPDVEPVDIDIVLPEDICETLADRIYQLCLAGDGASGPACAVERDTALDQCENPSDHVEDPAGQVGAGDLPTPPAPGPTSTGVYRIPYRDGTEIKVMNAYLEHTPQGKIDMHAKGASGQASVAAAAGTVRIIEDSRSKRQNFQGWLRKGGCKNNFVWIEHETSEWSKYSHMQQGSTTGTAGLSVGDRVAEGAHLGDEDSVGCATSAHLHFEVVVPEFGASRPFDPAHPEVYFEPGSGGLRFDPYRRRNRNPRICGITTTTFEDGESYVAVVGPGAVGPGEDEIVRHGMPLRNYACLVQRGVLAGYQPVWLDVFTIDGDVFVDLVMRPETGAWTSRMGLDASAFLAENEVLKALGYRLSQIEAYRTDRVRYAGIWEERGSPAQQVYIDKTATEHQAEVDRLTALGYRPRAVAVVDDGGLRYSAVWELVSMGWKLRSTLTLAEYTAAVRENAADGWDVASVNAYDNGGVPYFAAIWHPADGRSWHRTDLGKADFGDEMDAARRLGLHTVAVTAHDANGHGRYTGVFQE